jgi:hypothetical protein
MNGMFNPLDIGSPAFLGMAELEGQDDLVDTIDARFNAAINDMRDDLSWARGMDINLTSEINDILWAHDIDPSSLTQRQIARIEKAVE